MSKKNKKSRKQQKRVEQPLTVEELLNRATDYAYIEPSATMRQFADVCWQMYNALVQEGFTESQGIRLTALYLAVDAYDADDGDGD